MEQVLIIVLLVAAIVAAVVSALSPPRASWLGFAVAFIAAALLVPHIGL